MEGGGYFSLYEDFFKDAKIFLNTIESKNKILDVSNSSTTSSSISSDEVSDISSNNNTKKYDDNNYNGTGRYLDYYLNIENNKAVCYNNMEESNTVLQNDNNINSINNNNNNSSSNVLYNGSSKILLCYKNNYNICLSYKPYNENIYNDLANINYSLSIFRKKGSLNTTSNIKGKRQIEPNWTKQQIREALDLEKGIKRKTRSRGIYGNDNNINNYNINNYNINNYNINNYNINDYNINNYNINNYNINNYNINNYNINNDNKSMGWGGIVKYFNIFSKLPFFYLFYPSSDKKKKKKKKVMNDMNSSLFYNNHYKNEIKKKNDTSDFKKMAPPQKKNEKNKRNEKNNLYNDKKDSINMNENNIYKNMNKSNHMLTKNEIYKSTSVNNLDMDTKKTEEEYFLKRKRKNENNKKGISYEYLLKPSKHDYDAFCLFNPRFKQGKHHTVMYLQSYNVSIIPFVKAKKLKERVNQLFSEINPWIHKSLTLSKLRNLKIDLFNLINNIPEIDISTISCAWVFFERLVIKGYVHKYNRKLYAATCLILSFKFYQHDDIQILEKLLIHIQKLDKKENLTPSLIFSVEFLVYRLLEFSLQHTYENIRPHIHQYLESKELKFEDVYGTSEEIYLYSNKS
ncbi:cyclin dependent kinase binding protein, putative [Plasmodium gaboni]|uniref:Cyclin dependent kinase binding protein, putative n=1 Tax=Plasmodium gaboni TaxID=647221 RepID=A0ABY1UJ97_9APIC|nr:cyclin dependent kinase binding protein, putative [Plasmodium gaboni]